uniref:Uncharacterized protein n=1 Tax=Arion vulgaris TaxID=1028688 RepID=A0A0B7B2F2_9EUPU
MELKKSSMSTQERMTVMELMIRGTIERRFRVLESFNWQAIFESVQEIEMKEIPMLKKDVLECKQEQTLLHSEGVVNESNTANEVPVSPLSIQITEANIPEDATTVKTPAETTTTQAPIVTTEINPEFGCYVCGNNLTEEHCPIEKVNIKMACPKYKPFCITDIHQNGFTRHVYKRCASERDCKNGNANSDPSCETDIFVTAEAKQCHFCCTTKFCNENLRPTTDIYTKQ